MYASSDYGYELPPELIAQEPAAARDASRLLHLHADGTLSDHGFPDIVELLPPGAVVVANDTRVIPARVLGRKDSGGAVELLFLEPAPEVAAPAGTTAWRCLARARRPLRVGQTIHVRLPDGIDKGDKGESVPTNLAQRLDLGRAEGDKGESVPLLTERAGDGSVVVAAPGDGLAFLDKHGHVPLPRYIDRPDRAADRERYQTMFARVPGAVAAPTAGLHLTPAIVDRLRARDIAVATLTLHVGWGTFEPIRAADLRDHRMHRERYAIPAETAALVASGRPVVALGTTALRALEAAALANPMLAARAAATRRPADLVPDGLTGTTDLFIYPGSGHTFRAVDHLITNFHLPESTLLMLVCAFAEPGGSPNALSFGAEPGGSPKASSFGAGTDRVLAAYRHAVASRYRFYSYGDAMLLHRC